jgi:ubiquitin C-terminal hydrolase
MDHDSQHIAIDPTINKGLNNPFRDHNGKMYFNTCFFNSTLQSLFKCTDFISQLRNYNGESKLLKFLKITIEDYYLKSSVTVIGPLLLIRSYSEINPDYHVGTQDDAHECLGHFLDHFHEVTKKEGININDLFDCNLVSNLRCTKCNYESEKSETQKLITIPIVSGDRSTFYNNFQDALVDFSSDEIITDWKCEKCESSKESIARESIDDSKFSQINFATSLVASNTTDGENNVLNQPIIKVDAKKKLIIKGTPKYLYIGLKRFINDFNKEQKRYSQSKLNHDVLMPNNILINGLMYKMKGSIHHMGGLNGGHYVYFHKFGDDWTLFNDSNISAASKDNYDHIVKKGYVYLYERD